MKHNYCRNIKYERIAITEEKLYISKLKSEFGDKGSFTKSDLIEFYTDLTSDISQSLIDWRVLSLSKKGILERIGHGIYTFGKEKKFKPYLQDAHKKLFKDLDEKLPYAEKCIWRTSILNQFMIHQPGHFMTIIEIDREAKESAFYFLKDRGLEVFLEMDIDFIWRYSSIDKETVIVKALITEAPLQSVEEVQTVTLEKVLVDLFCDTDLFTTYQGTERSTIFKEAFIKYTININKLLRYAGRRGKRGDIREYLERLDLIPFKKK
ncbi:MAG: hypothetical protein EA360_10450 [Balneolaceae bacterium]|nr:MAG: hypothetical protein EA360_10450 [Balneolaceae bacterium]